MSQSEMVKLAIAVGLTFAAYKFVPNAAVKAAALGVMGTIVARQIPYVGDALGA